MQKIIFLKVYVFRFTVFSREPSSLIAAKEVGAVDGKHLVTSTPFLFVV